MLTRLARLKFELLAQGMQVADAARVHLAGSDGEGPLTLADYATTSGVPLRLPEDIWVNVPLVEHNPNFVVNPQHVLDWTGDGFVIRCGDTITPVEPSPVPQYLRRHNEAGQPHSWYGVTHTDRVRISPIGGCSNTCAFCDMPRTSDYRTKRLDLLLECIREALDDPVLPARHVLISGGTPRSEDHSYLLDVYGQVLAAFPSTPIDIMMVPLPDLLDVEHLVRKGVNELCINLELFNDDIRAHCIPQKAAIPKDDWLVFIDRAVQSIGVRVRSLLIVGLERVEDTLRGVEALAQVGCEPVLSPFRPTPQTPLALATPPSPDFLVDVFQRARDVAGRYGKKLGPKCLPCQHNTVALPDGTAYYHQ